MKYVSLCTLILATFALASCQSGQPALEGPAVELMDVPTFAQALKDNPKAQLVDVRTPAEYQEGTIEGQPSSKRNSTKTSRYIFFAAQVTDRVKQR